MVLILTAIIRGDTARAREHLARAGTAAERNPGAASLDGIALQVRGLVDGDAGLLARAVDRLEGSPRVMLLASALADHGALLLARGDRAEATGALQRAWSVYHDHGAVALAASVARTLEAAAVSAGSPAPPRHPGKGWQALTAAELAVAELIQSPRRPGAGHLAEHRLHAHPIGLRQAGRPLPGPARQRLERPRLTADSGCFPSPERVRPGVQQQAARPLRASRVLAIVPAAPIMLD